MKENIKTHISGEKNNQQSKICGKENDTPNFKTLYKTNKKRDHSK